jgi:hypothetical protein
VNLAIFFGVPLLCAGLASPRRVVQDRPGFLVDATAWLLTILVFAVAPEILRRALGAGEALALLRPGPSVIVVRRRPAAYIVSALALSAVWLVGLLGSALSHGVGALILGPLGLVVLAHTTSAWQHDVDASAPAAAPPQTPPPTPTETPPETPTDAPTDAPTDTPAAS